MANPESGNLEQRLQDDAMLINADVSPQLQSRIAASIHSAKQVHSIAAPHRQGRSYWWASSLTGVTAALLIILLVNRDPGVPHEDVTATATTVTPEVTDVFRPFPLNAKTADLTEPLEEELLHLQSDLEKAREQVKRDLRSAL